MSKFTKPKTDWAKLEKLVPKDQKTNFLAFKAKSDGYLRRVLASPATPPKIDWAAYQKIVPVPGLVDKLKSEYEAFKVPYPADTLTKDIDAQWAKLQVEIKQFVADRQAEIASAQKELNRINALPPFDTMTMEMVYDMYPDQRLDPVNNPTFWPHNPEEQLGYKPPEPVAAAAGEKK